MNKLALVELADLKKLEKIIAAGEKTFIEVGVALTTIREKRLYREGYETFDEYCQKRWGWTRQRASQLILAASASQGSAALSTMVDKHQSSGTQVVRSIAPAVPTERAIREFRSVPPEKREEVVKHITKSNGVVTAPAIKKAALEVIGGPPDRLDETGMIVPLKLVPLWDRGREMEDIMRMISCVKSVIKEAQDKNDILWRGFNFSRMMLELGQLRHNIDVYRPYAVCPYCSGKLASSYTHCKTRGFVGKMFWNQCVPLEMKKIREKATK